MGRHRCPSWRKKGSFSSTDSLLASMCEQQGGWHPASDKPLLQQQYAPHGQEIEVGTGHVDLRLPFRAGQAAGGAHQLETTQRGCPSPDWGGTEVLPGGRRGLSCLQTALLRECASSWMDMAPCMRHTLASAAGCKPIGIGGQSGFPAGETVLRALVTLADG
jgi:hypothetical protein